MTTPLLECLGVQKRFAGVRALDDVSISISAQTVHGVIGPNGAGKTTWLNAVSGVVAPDDGSIRFKGRDIAGRPPDRIARLGIGRTFQNVKLFEGLTALENVLVGTYSRSRTHYLSILAAGRAARRDERECVEKARQVLAFVGLSEQVDVEGTSLSYGAQRAVEVARALATDPELLLLDEPASGLTGSEKIRMADLLRVIKERGISLIVIDHDMKLITSVCDTVTVLDHGRKIAEGTPEEVQRHPEVLRAYLGRRGEEALEAAPSS